MQLSDDQLAAIDLLSSCKIGVLTGGPGTGKTTITIRVIEAIQKANNIDDDDITLLSPTGKAAVRLSEQTNRDSSTIHMKLQIGGRYGRGVDAYYDDSDRCDSPIYSSRLIVVDESSMIDARLAAHMLSAANDDAIIIFIGDVDQLPPVGPGAFFRDIIQSEMVSVARLTTIHRQDNNSLIATNCRQVLSGEQLLELDECEDFFVHRCEQQEDCVKKVVELCNEAKNSDMDWQVLCPQHNFDIGTANLNNVIRETIGDEMLSGYEMKVFDYSFRAGDRVINTKNNYNKNIMNGEIGYIVSIDHDDVDVSFGDRFVQFSRKKDKDAINKLKLAYAITVHKSQGSEYDRVIVICHSANSYMLSRNLLYTAISRGKKRVDIVCNDVGLSRAIRKTDDMRRNTRLVEFLTSKNVEKE